MGGFGGNYEDLSSVEKLDKESRSWSAVQPMTQKRSNLAAAALPNGQIVVIGGYCGQTLSSTEAFDPLRNQWAPTPSLSQARFNLGATTLEQLVYVVGGWDGAPLDTVETYDARTNKWSVCANMPTKRHSHGVCALGENFYAVGGRSGLYDPKTNMSVVECYDSRASKWRAVAPLLFARALFGIAAVDGAIYVAGGQDVTGDQV